MHHKTGGFIDHRKILILKENIQRYILSSQVTRFRGWKNDLYDIPRLKIEASVSNAQAYLAIPDFSAYLWGFLDGQVITNHRRSMKDIPGKTPLAEKISKDLQKKGFRFVGPTIVYAFMQACGLVNDHLVTCHRHRAVANAARR